jgi:hypothetical protein
MNVSVEPVSPELALVDPELNARVRAGLPDSGPTPQTLRRPEPTTPTTSATAAQHHRSYPFWARVTAAMWLVVLGILIGGAAIPHAQDTPRVVPQSEDARFCKAPGKQATPR